MLGRRESWRAPSALGSSLAVRRRSLTPSPLRSDAPAITAYLQNPKGASKDRLRGGIISNTHTPMMYSSRREGERQKEWFMELSGRATHSGSKLGEPATERGGVHI